MICSLFSEISNRLIRISLILAQSYFRRLTLDRYVVYDIGSFYLYVYLKLKAALTISRCVSIQGRAILESFQPAVATIICSSSDLQMPVQFVQFHMTKIIIVNFC